MSDTQPTGALPPTQPIDTSNTSLNGASPKDSSTSKLDISQENKQQKIIDLIKQFADLYPENKFVKAITTILTLFFIGNKFVKAIAIILALLFLLFSGGSVDYVISQSHLLFSQPQVKIAVTPTANFSTPLNGVDITGYCTSFNYTSVYKEGSNSYCYSPISDLNHVCNWQYDESNLVFQYSNNSDSDSGNCYTPQRSSRGGVNFDLYCTSQLHPDKKGGTPTSYFITNNGSNISDPRNEWVCQIEIDMKAACSWENNKFPVQARKDDQNNLQCYGN